MKGPLVVLAASVCLVQAAAAQATRPSARPAESCAPGVVGTFIASRAAADYLELTPDRRFFSHIGRASSAGTYSVSGSQVTLLLPTGQAQRATLNNCALVDENQVVWYKQTRRPFIRTDLTVSGIAVGMDSLSVRRRLGEPSSKDAVASMATWVYPGIRVEFMSGSVLRLELLDRSMGTARGLHVGDAAGRAVALYGRESFGENFDPRTAYAELAVKPSDRNQMDASRMIILLQGGIVSKILVGKEISVPD